MNSTYEKTRRDTAEACDLNAVEVGCLLVPSDVLHWTEPGHVTTIVKLESPEGEFWFGNAIGANKKLTKLATDEMIDPNKDDKLNEIMYNGIRAVMRGNPGSLKTVNGTPQGLLVFYGGTMDGARVYFTELDQIDGIRTFVKLAVCNSKNHENLILSLICGRLVSLK